MSKKIGFYKAGAETAKSFADEWVQAPKSSRNSAKSLGTIAKVGAIIGAGAMLSAMIAKNTKK